jgi:hypothetical protein
LYSSESSGDAQNKIQQLQHKCDDLQRKLDAVPSSQATGGARSKKSVKFAMEPETVIPASSDDRVKKLEEALETGMLSLGEFVMGDKNGIVEEAYEKDRELVDIQDEGTDEEYAEACKKYNVTPDVNGRVFTIDILESKLNDKYVCFDISAPMPSCAEEFYLYNFS